MANQEIGGQGLLGIIAPPPERPAAPVLPRPDVRIAPLSPEPPKRSLYKRLANVLRNRLVRLGLATGVIAAGGPALYHHINYEPKITLPAVGRDISSIPGFYWNLGRTAVEDIQGLLGNRAPSSEASTRSEETFNPSDVIKAHGFRDAPPRRESSKDSIPIEQLPTVEQHTEYAERGTYDNFDPGINFRIKEQPPVPYTYQNVTPKGLEPHTVMMDQPSFIRINGYVIRKEVSPEGNILLAVEVPGKNGLFNQNDIDKSFLSTETFTDNRHYDKISGAIVWLKIENFEGYSWPFGFSSSWNATSSAKRESNKITNIPGELLKYLRVGDPMNAIAQPELSAWDEEKLANNYKNQKNHLTYDQARKKYSNIVDGNAKTIQKMVEDARAGGVSLKEQLENKRYVLQVREANFVPRN